MGWLHPCLLLGATALLLLLPNAVESFRTGKSTPIALRQSYIATATDAKHKRLPLPHHRWSSIAHAAGAGIDSTETKDESSGRALDDEEWSLDDVIEAVFSKALVNVDLLMNFTVSSPEGIAAQALFQDCQSNVRVSPSTIKGAGRGLFAARDLTAGSIVNWYPIHALCLRDEHGEWKIVHDVFQDQSYNFNESTYALFLLGDRPLLGWDVQQELSQRQTGTDEHELPSSPPSAALYVDANPRRKGVDKNMAFQSYLINDGAKIEANTTQATDEYYQLSWDRLNVVFLPLGPAPLLAAVTTTDIAAGEELFTMYGRSYWMGQFCKESGSQWAEQSETAHEVERTMGEGLAALTLHAERVYAEELAELEEFFEDL